MGSNDKLWHPNNFCLPCRSSEKSPLSILKLLQQIRVTALTRVFSGSSFDSLTQRSILSLREGRSHRLRVYIARLHRQLSIKDSDGFCNLLWVVICKRISSCDLCRWFVHLRMGDRKIPPIQIFWIFCGYDFTFVRHTCVQRHTHLDVSDVMWWVAKWQQQRQQQKASGTKACCHWRSSQPSL